MKTNKQEIEQQLARVRELKKELGSGVIILGHHYQRQEIIKISDYIGDSFALAKMASEDKRAEKIIFCGVHFMAEAAAILNKKAKVYLPDPQAGCPMAEMANLEQLEEAYRSLATMTSLQEIVPITYINSSAECKAFCGKHGGLVCTSSNASAAMKYALGPGKKIIFFPDQHLGRNTAYSLGIEEKELVLFDPLLANGGLQKDQLQQSKIILWQGFCHVHTWFTTEQIKKRRQQYPACQIVVHPESNAAVVKAADANGSTGFIVDFVKKSRPGSTIIIGTEVNLVNRLAAEYPDRQVLPLSRSLCPNMFRTSLPKIIETLENFSEKKIVTVAEETSKDALLALQRMLELK